MQAESGWRRRSVPVAAVWSRCAGPWVHEQTAGSRASITGRWIREPEPGVRAEGLLLVQQSTALPGHPGLSQRLKSWIRKTSATLYGGRAGIVDALVLNARAGMTRSFAISTLSRGWSTSCRSPDSMSD